MIAKFLLLSQVLLLLIQLNYVQSATLPTQSGKPNDRSQGKLDDTNVMEDNPAASSPYPETDDDTSYELVGSRFTTPKVPTYQPAPETTSPSVARIPPPGVRETPLPGARETPPPGARETPRPGARETPPPGARQTPPPGARESPPPNQQHPPQELHPAPPQMQPPHTQPLLPHSNTDQHTLVSPARAEPCPCLNTGRERQLPVADEFNPEADLLRPNILNRLPIDQFPSPEALLNHVRALNLLQYQELKRKLNSAFDGDFWPLQRGSSSRNQVILSAQL